MSLPVTDDFASLRPGSGQPRLPTRSPRLVAKQSGLIRRVPALLQYTRANPEAATMTGDTAGTILHHLRDLVEPETTRALTDAQLLGRFATSREESAFAALVRRHGGLVWRVCRHLLRREQDAEDAFQATFLVLARRADAVRKTEAVGSFLHGVA